MTANTPLALELAATYGRFFAEDFAHNTLKIARPDSGLTLEQVTPLLANQTATVTGMQDSAVQAFLSECVDYALSAQVDNPGSREAWDHISKLPSLYAAEISGLQFNCAQYLNRTIDQTLFNVVLKDAHTNAELIRQSVQNRLSVNEMGGTINQFCWGILNDGMWLNEALHKAYSSASIFAPGKEVSPEYHRTAFAFAKQINLMEGFDLAMESEDRASLVTIFSQVPDATFTNLFDGYGETEFVHLMLTPANFAQRIEQWEQQSQTGLGVVTAVAELSTFAQILRTLVGTTQTMSSDLFVTDSMKLRLHSFYDAVSLSLAGIAALRETRFANVLLLGTTPVGDDPFVNVYVNEDNLTSYHEQHGTDEELLKIGMYYDERKGLPSPKHGYTLEHVMARQTDILSEMAITAQEREYEIRLNDRAVITNSIQETLTKLSQSYINAAPNVSPQIVDQSERRVRELSRMVNDPTYSLDLEVEITKMLVNIVNDQPLSTVSNFLLDNMVANTGNAPSSVIDATIAQTAGFIALQSF